MSVRRKTLIVSLALFLALFTGGCWNYRDLEDQHIPIAGCWDLMEGTQGMNRTLIGGALIPNLDPGARKKYHFELAAGKTPGQNRTYRAVNSPGNYILGMVQVELFGDELARDGLAMLPRSYLRNPQIKNTVQLAVVKGRAEELLRSDQVDYTNTGVYLRALLRYNSQSDFLVSCDLQHYMTDYYTPGKNPVMPLLKLKTKTDIEQIGCAVFMKDKLIDELDLAHTRTLVLLRGIKANGNIPFVVKENGRVIDRGTVSVRNSRRVKVSQQGDKINCRVEITLQGYLIDHRAGISLLNNDSMIKRIQASTAADVKRDCEAFIAQMQEDYKIDCIDVTRFVLAKWRKEYENKADKDLIQKMNISVQVKVKLEDYGESS